MKISVITPTIRKKGLLIVEKALKKQTLKDFEWIIGSPFNPQIKWAKWIKDKFTDGYWSLNRMYNLLLKSAKSDLIASWQDFIYAPPDTLQKIVDNLERYGKQSLVSGVGDQFATVDKHGKPIIKVWSDPRKNKRYGSFYECVYNDCEWNLAGFWKEAILSVGGMDEKLDFLGYGGDQLQTCERLNDAGHHFYLDQTMESFTLRHNRSDFGGQKEWDKNHVILNGKYDQRKKELKRSGKWPVLK